MSVKVPNFTWIGMRAKKLMLVRDVHTLDIVYSLPSCTLFCFGAIVSGYFYQSIDKVFKYYGLFSVFWYIIGGIISLLLAGCFAELSSLAPCSGALYDYTYNLMGEIYAFSIGWLLILSHSLRLFAMGQKLTAFIDFVFFDNLITDSTEKYLVFGNFSEGSVFRNSPDIAALFSILLVAGISSTITEESVIVNNVNVIINIVAIVAQFIIYLYVADISQMKFISRVNTTFTSFFDGLVTAQRSYAGFETAVYLGEEAYNPSVNIPKSINTALGVSMFCYTLVSFMNCLVSHDLKSEAHRNLTAVAREIDDIKIAKGIHWFISVGGTCALTATTYACMFALVRLLHAMSRDGLLFPMFSGLHTRTRTPVYSIFVTSFLIGIVGMCVKTVVITTLLTCYYLMEYVGIIVCLLLTRYNCEEKPKTADPGGRWVIINEPKITTPTDATEKISKLLLTCVFFATSSTAIVAKLLFRKQNLLYKYLFLAISTVTILVGILLGRQPQNNRSDLYYYSKGVPYVHMVLLQYCLVIVYRSSYLCWVFTLCWLFAGFVFYMLYSSRHSVEAGRVFPDNREERWTIMLTPTMIDMISSDEN